MVAHFMRSRLTDSEGREYDKEIETFFVSSSLLIASRHRLVAEAVMWGADYILWMDSDHVFPAESLCRLWARNVDIVGVNYRSEEHTSELQSLMRISYAVFCLKKKINIITLQDNSLHMSVTSVKIVINRSDNIHHYISTTIVH